jgi:hypothetical protein
VAHSELPCVPIDREPRFSRDPTASARFSREGLREALDSYDRRVADALNRRPDPPASEDLRSFIESVGRESDRAIPIVMMAYIDQTMVRILESELNPEVGQLFQTSGS